MIVIVAIVAILIGVLVGVLAAGGGGGNEQQASHRARAERTIKLEPLSSTSAAPFTAPISPPITPTQAPPPTIAPAPPGQGPFGGTGDNTLCDREQLISYLTDPAHNAQEQEWARIVGISVADLPIYIRDLIPTVLTNDTRVTNHTFENGRAVPLQSVLQAGTAVLVDQYGKLVARCRCGNPLREPLKVSDPVYTGPRWRGFDPTVIVIIVPKSEPVYPPGGMAEPTTGSLEFKATASNAGGTQSSSTTVSWKGPYSVAGDAVNGSGTGTVEFNGGCYDRSTGQRVSDFSVRASFSVTVAGAASGQAPNRTYALNFTMSNVIVNAINASGSGAIVDDCRNQATPDAVTSLVASAFGPFSIPARRGTTPATLGEFQGTYTLS